MAARSSGTASTSAPCARGGNELADLGLEALLLEAVDQRRELGEREVAVEDVDDRARHELLDHAVLARLVAERLELDLARGRGHDRRKVADARRGRRLVRAARRA